MDLILSPIFAHGIGGRGDLPIPFWLFSYQAILALVGSVILLAFFWKTSKLENRTFSGDLGEGFRIISGTIQVLLRAASLIIFLFVLFAALFGELGEGATIWPVTIYIILWVGLLLVSAFLGDVWRILSPFDTMAAIGQWVNGLFRKTPVATRVGGGQNLINGQSKRGSGNDYEDTNFRTLHPAEDISSWLAVFGLFVFVWLELVHPENTNTRIIGLIIFSYTLYLLIGASLMGRSWLKRADIFAIMHRLIGSLGIFPGKGKVRVPFVGTGRLELTWPETAFILVFLGSTTFDGVSNTGWWESLYDTTGWSTVPINTLGLIGTIFVVWLAYYIAMSFAAILTGSSGAKELMCRFAHSLIPIALAYSVAHYFSLLIFEGQDFIPLLSDPLGQGWDIFGTRHISINYRLVSTDVIAWIQALSILIGHLWGVFLAHDRAHSIWADKPGAANASQYPLVAIMIGYTVMGLYLLLNA